MVVGENPTDTLHQEEWSVVAARLTVQAVVKQPSGRVVLAGVAWLAGEPR